MPNSNPEIGSPEEWLRHAQSDLNLARLASHQPDVLPEQACFHAQQATEKAVKAVLLYRRIVFPFTHDIEELLELAKQGGVTLPSDVAESGVLTPYAVETRYPSSLEDIEPVQVDEAIRVAEHVVQWAAALVGGL